MTLTSAIATKEILVVCGAGGVGKTSVSAALALAGARDRKTIVLTIDPARRLATSLGLADGLAHAEREVELGDGYSGSLYAAMLDMKTAWDDLIERYAPSREVAQRIRANRIYGSLSEHFVGSQGYMAMERLADLHARGAYDLIVIDTPPTRHALDFLDAPKRMTDFIGGSLLRWFARPYAAAGRVGMRAFNVTATPLLRIADRILGSQVLEDLSEFVVDFQTLYGDFKRRADEVLRLLRHPSTGFVVVTTPEGPPLGEAGFFVDRLRAEGIGLAGAVMNKILPEVFAGAEAKAALEALERHGSVKTIGEIAGIGDAGPAIREAREALLTLAGLAAAHVRRVGDLGRRSGVDVTTVPLYAADVHDLETLAVLASALTG